MAIGRARARRYAAARDVRGLPPSIPLYRVTPGGDLVRVAGIRAWAPRGHWVESDAPLPRWMRGPARRRQLRRAPGLPARPAAGRVHRRVVHATPSGARAARRSAPVERRRHARRARQRRRRRDRRPRPRRRVGEAALRDVERVARDRRAGRAFARLLRVRAAGDRGRDARRHARRLAAQVRGADRRRRTRRGTSS